MPRRAQEPAPSPIDYDHFEGIPSPNGTIVPDIVLDWIAPDLSNAELRVLLYVIRRTFGFKKEADAISIDQICNGMVTKEVRDADAGVIREARRLDRGTGLSRSTVLDATRSLREKNLIVSHEQFDPRYGQQPTLYALKVRDGASIGGSPNYRTPPMEELGQGGSGSPDGGGPIVRTPGVRQSGRGGSDSSDPQTTVDQQTVDQQTDISNRKRPPQSTEGNSSDSSDSRAQRGIGKAVGTEPAAADDGLVAALVAALGEEFGDDAPHASRTRVANLQRDADLNDYTLTRLIAEASAITRSQARAITKRGRDGEAIAMPYFLRTLESLLRPAQGPQSRASPRTRARTGTGASPPERDPSELRPRAIDETDPVWRAALEELRLVLTPENYNAWLAGTRLIARTDDLLRIGVPEPFHRDWLEHKLNGRIASTLARLGYDTIRVEYVVQGA